MSTAKEKQALKMRKYRAKYKEKMRAYYHQYYLRKKKDKLRKERMGEKRCRLCEIRLASDAGAYGAKFYCESCVQIGDAKRHYTREASRRWRERVMV